MNNLKEPNMNPMINQISLMITNISSFLQQALQMKDLMISFFFFFTEIQIIKPLLFITSIIIIIIILITITLHHSLHQKKRYRPQVWPFLGMLPALIQAGLRYKIYDAITAVLGQQNGTFKFKGPWLCSSLTHITTSNPQNVEHILKTNFSNYQKGHVFTNCLHDFLGDGIFNADAETWLLQRKTSSVEFHSTEFRNMTIESLIELVHSRLIPIFEEKINKDSSTSFDMQEILMRLTFDNVCMISFGVDPRSLSLGLPEIPFARALEDATETVLLRLYTPGFIWKLMRFLNLGREKRLKKSITHVDEFVQEVISTKTKEMNLGSDQNNNNTRKRSDLMDVFMGLKDDEGKPFSNKFLRDICLNFILAGRDSSSIAMCWFFWVLDRNPLVEERILEELCRIVAEREEEEDRNGGVFSADEVKRMDYLQAVLSESLRLYPPLPFDRKQVVEDDVFPDGTKLKKGMLVLYSIYSMGRMESIWGKDCKEFKPERWLKDGQFVSESPYKFTAFNGGPRSCLGKDFAYYQMKFVAASIIYRYRVKVVENHLVVPKLALTMYMKYGLKVTLMKRDK